MTYNITLVSSMKCDSTFIYYMMHPYVIAALFTVATMWKQSKYPSIDEWIKMWDTHTHTCSYGLLLGHKKAWNLAICNNMDGNFVIPGQYYAKWSQSDK